MITIEIKYRRSLIRVSSSLLFDIEDQNAELKNEKSKKILEK